jgi:hypothetical protein
MPTMPVDVTPEYAIRNTECERRETRISNLEAVISFPFSVLGDAARCYAGIRNTGDRSEPGDVTAI